jgi:outer membrane protein assembly factor BamB
MCRRIQDAWWLSCHVILAGMWLVAAMPVAAAPAEPAAKPGKAYSDAEALRIGWPQVAGPFSTFEAPPIATPLVQDLSQAKLMWESECRDLGRAKGGSQAYRRVDQFTADSIAKMGSHPGSWAGPIVADGMVFGASWRPAGDWITVQGHKVRLDAEDFLVALDALTGKTRWLTAEPGGILRGGGKRQGFQVGPVYHRGVVYSLGSTARLFAYDAATGKKKWESDAHPARTAQQKARDAALAGAAAGKWAYDLTPNWCSSLAIAQDVLIVPDQGGGLVGFDPAGGAKKWALSGVIARWATPSVWRSEGKEYVLCANEKGALRLIDPVAGKELWKVDGLGPTWFTLTPGRTHVLVNVAAGSGKTKGAERQFGHLGAIRLSNVGGAKAWDVGGGHHIPVWMDSGARIRVLYRDGRFLVPHSSAEEGSDEESAKGAEAAPGKRAPAGPALLLDEASGKILTSIPAPGARDDQLAGLAYWIGDRVLSRADSFHGPKHGGRHPWLHWSVAGDQIARLPGKMDLSSFTNAYEVAMEAPLVAGLVFERTEAGTIVCYDLRAK